MKKKPVTIRSLRAAAKARGWDDVDVYVSRSPVQDVVWTVTVYRSDCFGEAMTREKSRQGAMRMCLAALRAK